MSRRQYGRGLAAEARAIQKGAIFQNELGDIASGIGEVRGKLVGPLAPTTSFAARATGRRGYPADIPRKPPGVRGSAGEARWCG